LCRLGRLRAFGIWTGLSGWPQEQGICRPLTCLVDISGTNPGSLPEPHEECAVLRASPRCGARVPPRVARRGKPSATSCGIWRGSQEGLLGKKCLGIGAAMKLDQGLERPPAERDPTPAADPPQPGVDGRARGTRAGPADGAARGRLSRRLVSAALDARGAAACVVAGAPYTRSVARLRMRSRTVGHPAAISA
jgi:hypothetical protein